MRSASKPARTYSCLTVALTAMWAKVSAAHAYHMVTGVTYSLAPATLYLLARILGASRLAALFSGIAFSLFRTILGDYAGAGSRTSRDGGPR